MRLIRRTRRTVGLLGPSGRYCYFWLHIWAGCGSEPVRRRCPETPPKVPAIHGATSGSPNSELIKALKKVCPPPPLKPNTMNYSLHREVNWVNCVICMNNLQHSETSMAGLMGRKREHWPEFQIRPHMSSREVLMVYI